MAESAQRALSGGAAPVELVFGRNEPQLHHFHGPLAAFLDKAVAPPPAARSPVARLPTPGRVRRATRGVWG